MKTRVLSTFLAVFLVGSLSLALAPPVLQGQEQEKKQEEKKAEKKKARKVWTNDDFPERPVPPPPPPPGPEQTVPEAAPGEDPWETLDELYEERKVYEQELEVARQQLDTLEQERRDAFGDPLRREAVDQGIEYQEQEILRQEGRLQELNAQIIELEKQTKGRKRPAPKEPPKPKEETETSPPAG